MTLYITIQYVDKNTIIQTVGAAAFLLLAVLLWALIKIHKENRQ
jgi:hypothetical protein